MSKTLAWLDEKAQVDLIKTSLGYQVETVTMTNSDFNLMFEQVKELEEENERCRHALKRIRLATNWKEEDREEIISHIYEEVNKTLRN